MTAAGLFQNAFRPGETYRLYFERIRFVASPGTDGVTRQKFDRILAEELRIIEQKVYAGTYQFTPYQGRLIPRKIDRTPRLIVKPTIRDRIVLRGMFEILSQVFEEVVASRTLHRQVHDAVRTVASAKFDHVLRFDVEDFYPSIDHGRMLRLIKRKIRQRQLVSLFADALKTPCDLQKSSDRRALNQTGVPQGLSIANVLANLYMYDLDLKYGAIPEIEYFRYVDDILVLCNNTDRRTISAMLRKDVANIGLRLHDDDKFSDIDIGESFDFLGYSFSGKSVGVRPSSKQKLEHSLIRIVTAHRKSKNPNIELLRFKLNLRITGCVFEKKKYGWVFYFSQMNDEATLHGLDHLVDMQLLRARSLTMSPKRFVKTWYEVRRNLSNTAYIPNFDKWDTEKQRRFLAKLGYPETRMPDTEVEYVFRRLIFREIQSLERDMAGNS